VRRWRHHLRLLRRGRSRLRWREKLRCHKPGAHLLRHGDGASRRGLGGGLRSARKRYSENAAGGERNKGDVTHVISFLPPAPEC
jgi:hypothetical protein